MQGDVEEKSAAVVVTTEPTGLMNQRAASESEDQRTRRAGYIG